MVTYYTVLEADINVNHHTSVCNITITLQKCHKKCSENKQMLECQAKNYEQAIMSHKMQKLKENREYKNAWKYQNTTAKILKNWINEYKKCN